jgi:hypothetical protein
VLFHLKEVYYPESWGRSPRFGQLNSGNARKGFPFTVEFTVSTAYGFAGNMRGDLSNCYSNTPLDVTLTGASDKGTFIGGFAADFNTDTDLVPATTSWTIENCYSTGGVTVRNTDSGYAKALRVGGFIGSLGLWGTDVTWTINVDTFYDDRRNVRIRNCYALGNVTVMSEGPGEISAGGFAGVTAMGSGASNTTVGRVYGYSDSGTNSDGSASNNYGQSTMAVEQANSITLTPE